MAGAVAVAAAAAAALGGDHSAGILRAGSTRAPGWVCLQWVLTEVLKLLQPVRPNLRSLLLLSSQSTSKVLTQEKDRVTAERGVETWTTDMTSLQLLGVWGDILPGIC